MTALLLCIACNAGIFLCFRTFQLFRINTFQAIIINYITCVIIGVAFVGWTPFQSAMRPDNPWLLPAAVLGVIFIGTFYLMARTTQLYSMTVASIASKMSLIIPVLFSLVILGSRVKEFTWLNYAGMILALFAIVFSPVGKGDISAAEKTHLWYYPLLVVLFGGIIDTSLNFLNHSYVQRNEEGVFPIYIFLVAAIAGLLVQLYMRSAVAIRSLVGGIILGSVNYFSLYFVLTGLSEFQNDGAFFFPMLNVGIILASSLLSVSLFKEKLLPLNLTGIMLAVLAIILLSYQEIGAFIRFD